MLQQVLDYIKEHPEEWKQDSWDCCFLGLAEKIRTGQNETIDLVALRRWLGVSELWLLKLMNSKNTLENLERIIVQHAKEINFFIRQGRAD